MIDACDWKPPLYLMRWPLDNDLLSDLLDIVYIIKHFSKAYLYLSKVFGSW